MINETVVINTIKENPHINTNTLLRKLNISPRHSKILTNMLINLSSRDLIAFDKRDSSYVALRKINTIQGPIHFASEGKCAFVDVEELSKNGTKSSYFVSSNNFNTALNNDIVEADVFEPISPDNNRTFAKVKKIIERRCKTLIGVLDNVNGFVTFKPIEPIYKNTSFRIKNIASEARVLDVVVAEIINYENRNKEINIIKRITDVNDPMAYVKSLEEARNVPREFPAEVNEYIQKFIPENIKNEDLSMRTDLRNDLVVTIDGSSTKDFDDAISVVKIDENTYELGVHIADVAYYVKENTPLDDEALKRGTSIYLLNEVVPMLPFKLSNGICSLNPNEERLTISCITKINKLGQSIETKIVPSVIKSKYRLTYERVNEFINESKDFEDKELNKMLKNAYELSQIIREFKNKQGYIDFEIQEPHIELDSDGRVLDISVEKTGESEKMIEDFMVRANEEVAKFITNSKLPMMYRIHEVPSEEKIEYFLEVLKSLKINVSLNRKHITPLTFQKIINQINSQRNDEFLKMLFLRTMQKAVYSPDNIGHFGLASECYCHFTSPIRRYPDVIVHRVLWDFVFKKQLNKVDEFAANLQKIAAMNSASEENAVQLERDVNDLKFAEYFKSKINSEFEGQVFGITKFGMFIQFDNKTDAMVHISNIGDGDFEANEQMTKLYSKNDPKKAYKLGQTVRVVITNADETTGKIDCVLAKDYKTYLRNKVSKNFNQQKGFNKR
ncbi:ribonuclease R [Mycoplasmopsis agalactiae]|uniref:ribonuclease R n=1 Tax=Mycoplasmopsis agalactiae TaxID=2110 RepID=UPI001455DCD6|nr:ribonuclease R [Mycoplasmopsis agalactiae]MCE6114418.1 ribonuclease R [Mycoplasmopsis agalactiae]NLS34253.1 ribonuclease R [Mycoplasmopsis agalactiae]